MYQTILFDIDGVMLSEERYFDASALTVYELLSSPRGMGLCLSELPPFRVQPVETEMRVIRQGVFADDAVLYFMKSLGVNANWDMVYLQFATQLLYLLESVPAEVSAAVLPTDWTGDSLRQVGMALKDAGHFRNEPVPLPFRGFIEEFSGCKNRADLFAHIEAKFASYRGRVGLAQYCRGLWELGQTWFQEWYLGDEYLQSTVTSGKEGFLHHEIPLVSPDEFAGLLQVCRGRGITLGVATGRPDVETRVPLGELGWLRHFDPDRITTASDVLRAQGEGTSNRSLSKPDPFSYLRSYLGTQDVTQVLSTALPLPETEANQVLVVGDSVADWMAARHMGVHFAAVLTGLAGVAARPEFENLGCDYIWENALGLQQIL
ncbi:HAD family hydrolase [Alicyclobacillaceae bacterium I2511]|nr:HAD family hydrolase [Alicyclobacillaceae bacterium I2511]